MGLYGLYLIIMWRGPELATERALNQGFRHESQPGSIRNK